MIRNIRIENFKSILEDDITLKDFTVIIGANGTGKSNLIKALEFLSAIPNIGLVAAVNKFGGYDGIIPKAIPVNRVKKTNIKFKYTTVLPPPKSQLENMPPITVDHEFEFSYSHKDTVRVTSESIIYHNILAFSELLENQSLSKIDFRPSSFRLLRSPRRVVKYTESPPFSNDNLSKYIEWFGLPFRATRPKSVSALRLLLEYIERLVRKENKISQTFLDPEERNVTGYSAQARQFFEMLKYTRRYDLLLSELRKEQQVSESSLLSSAGTNMPSVVRYLQSSPDSNNAINRILSTMSEISPHIKSFDETKVRTGKEFIEFLEYTSNRTVESWESSDGTLRTLAILLALETQPTYTTILIEEPELNLHPWAIRSIIEHMRQAIKNRHIQIIITTHSQQVLEMAHPDEVLIATRSKEKGTKFNKLENIVPHANIEIGEIGRMWVKGLLGGVPSLD